MLNTAERIALYVILILQVRLLPVCASRGFSLFSQKSVCSGSVWHVQVVPRLFSELFFQSVVPYPVGDCTCLSIMC